MFNKSNFIIYLLLIFIQQPILANPWVQKASFGGVGRHRACGIAIGNRGYMGLGHVNGTGVDISYKDWWAYDPASNSWTQKANYPVNNHGAVTFSSDTRGYVGGGSALSNEFYEYNPVTNSWSPIAPCPLTPGDTQGFSIQNKGYVYQGNQLVEYDPSTNSWAIKASAPYSFSSWSCSFATESSGFVKSGTTFYEYKPANNQWILRAPFPGLMSNGSSAFSKDNKGYVTCGFSGGLSTVTDEVWEFNPGNNTWTFICHFPGTKRRFPVAFAINDKGYFGTGTNGINMNDFWAFDFDPLEIDQLQIDNIVVNVYPNPTNDLVNFQLNNIENLEYSDLYLNIHTSDGRTILTDQFNSNFKSIERNNLLSGIYFYSIVYKNKIIRNGKIK
jgi:N-acetylneuraminic acid mutarotase